MEATALDKVIKEISHSSNEIVSIYSYGSVFSVDYTQYSDIDILIVFEKNPSVSRLNDLAKIKKRCFENGSKLDISIHTVEEILRVSTGNFFHNNRGVYFVFELKLTGSLLYGEDIVSSIEIEHKDLIKEIPKVVNSMKYNLRKLLTSNVDNAKVKKICIKYALNCASAALYSQGIFPVNKKEIITKFADTYGSSKLVSALYHMRLDNYGSDSPDDTVISETYEFICDIDSLLNN